VTLLATLTVIVLILVVVEHLRGGRQLASFAEVVPRPDAELPMLSVVIAARDERRHIEQALESVLAQRYPGLEVIAVDDRSTDGTAEILDRLAEGEGERRLRVMHITELPPGWLGKNHALFRGASMATGELLLFADADVVMEPTTLRRAASYMETRGLDHLTAVPRVLVPGALLTVLVVTFSMLYTIFVRPWRARDSRRGNSVGVGAFNLVRSHVYWAIGGHEAIRMRPDDDTKLGKLIKKRGFRQEMVIGVDFISVEWYASFRELTRGLMKNGYSQLDYRLSLALAGTAVQLVLFIWPFAALALTNGLARVLNVLSVVILLGIYVAHARLQRTPPWYAVGFPVAALLAMYLGWRSVVTTLRNRGIEWRGTHYSLDLLRANRV
jgi:hypothetical protein